MPFRFGLPTILRLRSRFHSFLTGPQGFLIFAVLVKHERSLRIGTHPQ